MGGILCVVGWQKHQHYKDRDPPWVKLYRDLLTTESWVLGTDLSRLVQLASILLAARYNNKIPFQWTLIRKVSSLDCSERDFNSTVQHLVKHKFLEIQEDTNDAIDALAHGASNALATCTSEAEAEKRQRRGREDTTASATPTRTLTVSREADAEWFLDFKLAYPHRAGDQGWRKAQKAASARMAEGHTSAEFIAGAKRYADFCAATGKVGTEYVKQAATFLGPDKPFLEPWSIPAAEGSKGPQRREGLLPDAFEVARRAS